VEQDFTEIQELVALKRFEGPGEDYFEEFLDEFHRRQRADLMSRSARSLFMERIAVWFKELGAVKYAYGAGLAYAVLFLAFSAWPRGGGEQPTIGAGATELPGNRTLEQVEFVKPLKKDASPTQEF
jgi:hypothetical protein